ncbi:MAG: serine--tRNA ligase [Bacteroidota bacterium]
MLEIQVLRNKSEEVIQGLEKRNIQEARPTVEKILQLDEQRRNAIREADEAKQRMNQMAKSIGMLMKEGKKQEAEEAKAQTSRLKESIKEFDEKLKEIEGSIRELIITLPNVPHESVPAGKDAADNVTLYQHDVEVAFSFSPLPHWELALNHTLINWELGAKITGSGFPVYIGKGAKLQRALISFFLDMANEAGYTEVQPPLMVNEDSAFATGQLPDKDGQMYHATEDNFFLIPTAEVPITNLYRDNILAEDDLPIKNCGYTPCFRREAGSYGKDVKGLNRLHQFDKVELVQVVHPEKSYEVLEEMTNHVAGLLEALKLPYRKLILCTGDATFTSAKTYDMEVFSAGQERWLEVSSISNFETFQTNRLKLRFKNSNKKTQLAHSLNGSALALPRILAAILENNQQEDGSISVPEVLRPYTRFDHIG